MDPDLWTMHALMPFIQNTYADMWQKTARLAGNGGIQALAIILALAAAWYFHRNSGKRCCISCLAALMLSGLTVQFIKFFIGRARPCLDLPAWTLKSWTTANNWHSFPSGHAASSFAIASVMSSFYPGLWWLWFSAASFIGIGRVLGESHYPTDVLAGAVVGGLCGSLAVHIVKRFYQKRKGQKLTAPRKHKKIPQPGSCIPNRPEI